MVYPDVDGYILKPEIIGKYSEKHTDLLKTKIILKMK